MKRKLPPLPDKQNTPGIPLRNPRFLEASADVNLKHDWLNDWLNGRSHNESQNHALF